MELDHEANIICMNTSMDAEQDRIDRLLGLTWTFRFSVDMSIPFNRNRVMVYKIYNDESK